MGQGARVPSLALSPLQRILPVQRDEGCWMGLGSCLPAGGWDESGQTNGPPSLLRTHSCVLT